MFKRRLVDRNSGMWSTESARHIDVLPLDGLGRLVVLADVAHEFRVISLVEVKMSRAMTSRSILLSQSSTWLSQLE